MYLWLQKRHTESSVLCCILSMKLPAQKIVVNKAYSEIMLLCETTVFGHLWVWVLFLTLPQAHFMIWNTLAKICQCFSFSTGKIRVKTSLIRVVLIIICEMLWGSLRNALRTWKEVLFNKYFTNNSPWGLSMLTLRMHCFTTDTFTCLVWLTGKLEKRTWSWGTISAIYGIAWVLF